MTEEQTLSSTPETRLVFNGAAQPLIEQFISAAETESASRLGPALPSLALVLFLLGAVAVTLEYEYTKHAPRLAQLASAAVAGNSFGEIELTAKAAIVEDLVNGRTLYAKNPDIQLPLASLTKVALVLAISEALLPEEIITIPYDTAPKGSAERLAKGEKWPVRDIVDFTLIASSNAGAEILASAADEALRSRYSEAPEGQAALWRMNKIAEELGLSHTYFLNASGLDVSSTLSGAYGSASDMAELFSYAAALNPGVFGGTAEDGILLTAPNGSAKTRAFNTNEALGSIPGLIMGKTGITDLAGGNLAIVFDVGLAHPIVAVVLGSTREERFNDMRMLISETQRVISQPEKAI